MTSKWPRDPIMAFRIKLEARIRALNISGEDDRLLGLMEDLDSLFAAIQPTWCAVASSYMTLDEKMVIKCQ